MIQSVQEVVQKVANKKKVTFEEGMAKWEKEMAPEIEACRAAERITAKDLSITINTRYPLEEELRMRSVGKKKKR